MSGSRDPDHLDHEQLEHDQQRQVLLPLSERGAKQVQKVISEFNRSRDLLFVED